MRSLNPNSRRCWWLLLAVVAALLTLGSAAAQPLEGPLWTVQTVALRDLRDAEAEVNRLARLGLPAYVTFTMVEGLQYVRVRVGCYDAREGATALATLIAGRVVGEAIAVPVDTLPPDSVGCVRFDVGFRLDTPWSLASGQGEVPLFRLEVGGQIAYLRYELERWRLWQRQAPDPLPSPAASAGAIRAVRLSGERAVAGPTGFLCPGELVAQAGDAAFVKVGDALVACRWQGRP